MRIRRKLEIELVPETAWNNNLRAIFSRKQWDILRKQVYAAYGNQCAICSSSSRLAAHEVWEYDEDNLHQILTGLVALCNMCHYVKHIGFAQHLASQDKLNFDAVVGHYCRINKVTRAEFQIDLDAATEEWEERSKYDWELILPKKE